MLNINDAIGDKVNESITTNRTHIENIKEMKDNIENNICPRCGASLVERNSKHGIFLGCSNYPNCKFKKKL